MVLSRVFVTFLNFCDTFLLGAPFLSLVVLNADHNDHGYACYQEQQPQYDVCCVTGYRAYSCAKNATRRFRSYAEHVGYRTFLADTGYTGSCSAATTATGSGAALSAATAAATATVGDGTETYGYGRCCGRVNPEGVYQRIAVHIGIADVSVGSCYLDEVVIIPRKISYIDHAVCACYEAAVSVWMA